MNAYGIKWRPDFTKENVRALGEWADAKRVEVDSCDEPYIELQDGRMVYVGYWLVYDEGLEGSPLLTFADAEDFKDHYEITRWIKADDTDDTHPEGDTDASL